MAEMPTRLEKSDELESAFTPISRNMAGAQIPTTHRQ